MKNWKTTVSGALCLAICAYLFYLGQSTSALVALMAGLGLLGAKDHNVTGTN